MKLALVNTVSVAANQGTEVGIFLYVQVAGVAGQVIKAKHDIAELAGLVGHEQAGQRAAVGHDGGLHSVRVLQGKQLHSRAIFGLAKRGGHWLGRGSSLRRIGSHWSSIGGRINRSFVGGLLLAASSGCQQQGRKAARYQPRRQGVIHEGATGQDSR